MLLIKFDDFLFVKKNNLLISLFVFLNFFIGVLLRIFLVCVVGWLFLVNNKFWFWFVIKKLGVIVL